MRQKIIQDQLDSVGTDWLDIEELQKALVNKQKQLSTAIENLSNGETTLSNHKALKSRLQAYIERFDVESREEQVEKHKGLLKDISIIERHIRSTKMEIQNYQNKIDLLHDHEYDPNCKFCCDNQFVKEAEEAKTLIEKSRESLRAFEHDLEIIIEKKDAINITYIEAEIGDFKNNSTRIKTNEAKIQSIQAQISANKSKKTLFEKEIEEISSKIDYYHQNKEAFENLESLQRDLVAIEKTLVLKNRPPIPPEVIVSAFARKDLKLMTTAQELESYIDLLSDRPMVLLLMSSGNYGGLDLSEIFGWFLN